MAIDRTETKALLPDTGPINTSSSDHTSNRLTRSLLKIVSWLHDPIIYSAGAVHRVIQPWDNGRKDLCSTWPRELAARLLYSGSLLATVPVGLLAGALAIPVRCLATGVKNQDYCYARGDAPEKNFGPTFSLMTWNICFHEGGMSMSTGGMVPGKYRIDAILQTIREKDPDILCLQEVQSIDSASALFEKLKGIYPHCYYNLGIHPLKSSSGLIVFSKFSTSFHFTPFQDAAGWARQEDKGVASLLIANRVHVCFTHLQWGGESSFEVIDARNKQILQIANLMAEKNLPAILAGDLNLDRNGSCFERSALPRHFEMAHDASPTWTNYFIQKMWKGEKTPKTSDEQSIDYIARFKRVEHEESLVIEVETVTAFDQEPCRALSDHHGLFAKVSCI